MSAIERVQHQEIAHASHMLHHDQPQVLANSLSQFLSDASSTGVEMTG
jgi:pimeloyl-ACP methyl ester carboxylesterase